nr:uncharacterized mitochondrial protein AtMg00810-like [Tanacetum cinerariifolium]
MVVYASSDHTGDYVDRKSTSGICTFVGCCMTSWFSKKQTALAISTTEAEYISAKKNLLKFLTNGIPTDGPYQTNPPSPDDIISYIQNDQEDQVCRICHEEEIDVHEYQILTHEIVPTLKPLEEIIPQNIFCLETRKDHDMRRGRHSTSSSSAFDKPSSSHLNDDDNGNDEGTSHASTPSPIRFVNSLTNEVP